MLRLGMLLLTVTVLSGCLTTFSGLGTRIPETNAVCDGLENPLVDHAKAMVTEQEETPELVLRTGATLIQAYRAGCD